MSLAELNLTYLGCFQDAWSRWLPYEMPLSLTNTVEECMDRCYANKSIYSGTEFMFQCFCGNERGSLPQLPDSWCNTTCIGDSSQICGGSWSMSVWELTGFWSDWSAWSNCSANLSYYVNNLLTELIYDVDCSSVGEEQVSSIINDRNNQTEQVLAQITTDKQAALASLDAKYHVVDTVATASGQVVIVVVLLFVLWILSSDLLRLLAHLKIIKPVRAPKRKRKHAAKLRRHKLQRPVYVNSATYSPVSKDSIRSASLSSFGLVGNRNRVEPSLTPWSVKQAYFVNVDELSRLAFKLSNQNGGPKASSTRSSSIKVV